VIVPPWRDAGQEFAPAESGSIDRAAARSKALIGVLDGRALSQVASI